MDGRFSLDNKKEVLKDLEDSIEELKAYALPKHREQKALLTNIKNMASTFVKLYKDFILVETPIHHTWAVSTYGSILLMACKSYDSTYRLSFENSLSILLEYPLLYVRSYAKHREENET